MKESVRGFLYQCLYYVVLVCSILPIVMIVYQIYQIASFLLSNKNHLTPDLFQENISILVWAVLCIILSVFTQKILFSARIVCRNNFEFDSTGMKKKFNSYDKMSAKDKEEMDKQKLMDMERLLDSATIRRVTAKGTLHPEEEMNRLIGLDSVKEEMGQMAARMKYERSMKKKEPLSTHMCFMGPPGTGKTTCARIMTGFLYQNHYIKKNKCIEVDGNFLRSGGETSKKTERLILQALGGVLFIDEAYALLNARDGQEAIATIVKMMEDYRDQFVLIVAGYEDEMKDFIQSNPGIFSRIKHYLWFESYSTEELQEIFISMAKENGFTVTEDALEKVGIKMEKDRNNLNFGNARSVRNCLEQAIDKHAFHYINKMTSKKSEIEACDIELHSKKEEFFNEL